MRKIRQVSGGRRVIHHDDYSSGYDSCLERDVHHGGEVFAEVHGGETVEHGHRVASRSGSRGRLLTFDEISGGSRRFRRSHGHGHHHSHGHSHCHSHAAPVQYVQTVAAPVMQTTCTPCCCEEEVEVVYEPVMVPVKKEKEKPKPVEVMAAVPDDPEPEPVERLMLERFQRSWEPYPEMSEFRDYPDRPVKLPPKPKIVEKIVEVKVPYEVEKIVKVEVPVEVEKEVIKVVEKKVEVPVEV